MPPRESVLPVHFEGKHKGKFQATGKLSVCSRCGKVGFCTCKEEQEELDRRKMERRVQNELGLNRPTRRYCMNLCKIIRNVLKYIHFSLNFVGEPESSPGTTRVTIDVEFTIYLPFTSDVTFLRTVLKAFIMWRCME